MAVTGIEHIGVVSNNTAVLKDWYMEVFGGKVVYDNGKGTYFLQFEDGSMIEFVSAEADRNEEIERTAGIRHIAFSVSSEAFDEITAVLKKDERVQEVHDVSENASGLKTYDKRTLRKSNSNYQKNAAKRTD